jgi:hypothetical protein
MTLKIYGKLPDTPAKLTAFTSLDQSGYDKYVIYDDVKAFSDKTPLTVSNSKETTPSLGTITKKFNTVAPEQLFDIVSSSGYVTGQPTKHAYFCELKAKDGYQFSETSEISIPYSYTNPFTGSTVTFTEKIPVTEKTQTVYIFGMNQKPKIYAPKDISATNLIKEKPVETLEPLLNVYRMSNSKLKKFKESRYTDSDGAVLQFSKFVESIKPLKLNFDALDVETGVKIGNNTLTDFTLPHLKNIENVKVASFNLSNMTNNNDPVINLVNPFVKPFQLKNVNFGKILDIYLTWNVQKDLLEFKCYQDDRLIFTNSVKYGDKVNLYQQATSTVVKVGDNSETYENVFYLQIETNKIDDTQKVFEVDSYKSYNNLPKYFVCDNIENVNIPENDFEVIKKIVKAGVYRV